MARLVAGGHVTKNIEGGNLLRRIVKMDSIRLSFLLDGLNKLEYPKGYL